MAVLPIARLELFFLEERIASLSPAESYRPGGGETICLPADGSSTRGGSTSVRGRVRSPPVAKLQAASVPIAYGSCAPRAGTDRRTDGLRYRLMPTMSCLSCKIPEPCCVRAYIPVIEAVGETDRQTDRGPRHSRMDGQYCRLTSAGHRNYHAPPTRYLLPRWPALPYNGHRPRQVQTDHRDQ